MKPRRRHRRAVVGTALLLATLGLLPASSRPQDGALEDALAVAAHTAVGLSDGRLLIAGGTTGSGVVDRAWVVDPTRLPLAIPLLAARASATATLRPDGRVVVVGGADARGAVGTVELVDPAAGHSQLLPVGLGQAVAEHAATLLPDGRVLVVGGRDIRGAIIAALQVLDLGAGQVVEPGDLGVARAGHSVTLLSDGRVLIVGGHGGAGVLGTAEILDARHFATSALAARLSSSRAGHTATLLPDGEVLIAGGIGADGHAIDTIERFDPVRGTFRTDGTRLPRPRAHHSATLLPTGAVLLWGGVDGHGALVGTGDVIDPRTGAVYVVPAPLAGQPVDQTAPGLAESVPAAGAHDVALTGAVSLRFSEPLRVTTATTSVITLGGPGGPVPTTVVPTESGLLLWITPTVPLQAATHYVLQLDGLTDTAGLPLGPLAIDFTTVSPQRPAATAASMAPAGTAHGEDEPEVSGMVRDQRTGQLFSRWQALPPLQAPPGVTAVSGQVLRLNGTPLANVTLQIDDRSTRTDDTGRFLVIGPPSGPQVLVIDGRTASRPGATYGLFEVSVSVTERQTTVLPYTSWMPTLAMDHAVTIASPTSRDVVLTHPGLPGLAVHLPAGTLVRDREGHLVSQLSLTPVPPDRPPFPMPAGIQFPVYFTIQPGGASLEMLGADGPRGGTARVIYPNATRQPPGTTADFWNYEPEGGVGWYRYGRGVVTPDGERVEPDSAAGLYKFTMSAFLAPTQGTPPPMWATAGDPLGDCCEPVNLATGLFLLRKVDLIVDDVVPVVLERRYRPGDPVAREFGIGASHPYALFLWSPSADCPELNLILPDGTRLHYNRVTAGQNCYDTPAPQFVHTETPTPFYRSTISCSVALCALLRTDGTEYHFETHVVQGRIPYSLVAIRDRYGNSVTVTYPGTLGEGSVTRITSPNGRFLDLTYDAQNRIRQARDSLGRAVIYRYDAQGRLASVTDPAGGVTEYGYDTTAGQTDRLLTIKDPRGLTFLTNRYDARGRVDLQTLADPTLTYQISYEDTGPPTFRITAAQVTDPRGYIRRVEFNTAGYVTRDVRALGQPEAQPTTYERASPTNPTSQLITRVTDPLGRVTTYDYDTNGNVVTMTRLPSTPLQVIGTFGYEPPFAPGFNRINRVQPSTATTDGVVTLTYTGLTQTTITDARAQATVITYNAAGQPLTVTNPMNEPPTRFEYTNGNLTAIQDPQGNRTTRAYDAAGRLVSQTDPRSRTTAMAYDALNQLRAIGDPAGGATRFTYDPNGNLLSVTDARGNATSYHYDAMDRMDQRTDPLARTEVFHYDANGNLDQDTDRKSQVTTFTYDGLSRRTGATSPGITTTYTWDGGDRLTQVVDSVGGTVTSAFDDLDRLTSQTTALGTVSYPEYDSLGRRKQMQVPGQAAVLYRWDAASRLTQITQGSQVVTFGYDNANRRTSLTLPNGVSTAYGYDVASRLASLIYNNGIGELGRLSYGYDLASNRTSVGGSFARTLLPPAVASASYDAANRQLTFGATTLGYDFNGNLTTLTDATGQTIYTWDARDRLTALSAPAPTTAAFGYDGLGRRITRTVNGTTTQYIYDGVDIVQEQVAGTPATYLRSLAIDEPLVRNGSEFYLGDALGSTIALTDTAGAMTTEYGYEPFGATSVTGTASGNPFAFTGREEDRTGLKYYRARYYDPGLARFISEDPIGSEGGFNLYAYVENNPVQYTDPLGYTKGGPQNISVTHDGKVLTKRTPIREVQRALEEAIGRGMSPAHIKKLRGLIKVIARGGTYAGIIGVILGELMFPAEAGAGSECPQGPGTCIVSDDLLPASGGFPPSAGDVPIPLSGRK